MWNCWYKKVILHSQIMGANESATTSQETTIDLNNDNNQLQSTSNDAEARHQSLQTSQLTQQKNRTPSAIDPVLSYTTFPQFTQEQQNRAGEIQDVESADDIIGESWYSFIIIVQHTTQHNRKCKQMSLSLCCGYSLQTKSRWYWSTTTMKMTTRSKAWLSMTTTTGIARSNNTTMTSSSSNSFNDPLHV